MISFILSQADLKWQRVGAFENIFVYRLGRLLLPPIQKIFLFRNPASQTFLLSWGSRVKNIKTTTLLFTSMTKHYEAATGNKMDKHRGMKGVQTPKHMTLYRQAIQSRVKTLRTETK